jgi:Fic family protein
LLNNYLLLKPSLYLSEFFEKHRGQYYDALTRVRESNDLGHWVRFFLQAVVDTAEKGKVTCDRILKLHRSTENNLVKLGRRAENARKLLMHLYQSPVVNIKQVEDLLNLSYARANSLVASLVSMSIVQETTGFSRNRIFVFRHYIDAFTN